VLRGRRSATQYKPYKIESFQLNLGPAFRIGSSRLRILQAVLSQGFYGSERYCIELALAQANAGHAVAIIIQGGASDCAREFRRHIDGAGLGGQGRAAGVISLYVIPQWLPPWLHRAFALVVIRRFTPDIVHTHLNPAARRIGAVAKRLGIAHVATLHINYEAREHEGCDGLIAIASWQKARVPVELQDKVAVIFPWLPSEVRTALSDATPDGATALRHEWGADDATVFGSVGRLVSEKGMDVLIAAFRMAFPRGDERVRLVIVGEGPQRSRLQELADGDGRIVLGGATFEVAAFYRAFDVFVSAARFEPFGLAILEAMAAGLPIVATKTWGPREFVADDRVLWVDIGDEGALSANLKQAYALGRVRYPYDVANFSRERAAEDIESFYRDVTVRHRHLR
jgi:glycosyltransferase involved in cell wall biosynthesis